MLSRHCQGARLPPKQVIVFEKEIRRCLAPTLCSPSRRKKAKRMFVCIWGVCVGAGVKNWKKRDCSKLK